MRSSIAFPIYTLFIVAMWQSLVLSQNQKVSSPQVGAIYHTCFHHSGRHLKTAQGKDALNQHFKSPKTVNNASAEWHTTQLDKMMTASLDFVALAWPMHSKADHQQTLTSLKALIEARSAIAKAGGTPPKIALFLESIPHIDQTTDTKRLDLRTETARSEVIDQILSFFAIAGEEHRLTLSGFLPIFVGPASGTPHNNDLFRYLLFLLKKKLELTPYFVVERSWDAEVQASWTSGAPLHGPANDTPIAFIGPGFDNQLLPNRGGPIRHRENTRFYQRSFDTLLLRRLSLVVIDSWNQFHDATGIAPSVEHGDNYLDITHRYIHLLKAGAVPDIKNPVRLAHPSPLSRPDKGWWSPSSGTSNVSFNPAVQPGDRGNGLRLVPTHDSPARRVMGTETASVTTNAQGSNTTYLYFGIADEFMHNTARCAEVTIDFIDGGEGTLRLQYDSWRINEKRKGSYSSTPRHSRRGLPRRRKARFILPEARFANRQAGGADFRIEVRGAPLGVLRVSVGYAVGEPPASARLVVE